MINVVIVDDHLLILKGLKEMLKASDNINVVAVFSDGKTLLDYLETNQPDILLLDINIPNINGLDICKKVALKYSNIKILALTNYNENSIVKNMMRNGAKGYLLKNCSQQELIESIHTVYQGGNYFSKEIENQLVKDSIESKKNNSFMPKLTRREKEVLIEISAEKTNQEISECLFISVKTVESHRNNLLQKFGVKNTAGLIKEALIKGYIS
jgi:DNA-binding NarL/FixJ family response regulator